MIFNIDKQVLHISPITLWTSSTIVARTDEKTCIHYIKNSNWRTWHWWTFEENSRPIVVSIVWLCARIWL